MIRPHAGRASDFGSVCVVIAQIQDRPTLLPDTIASVTRGDAEVTHAKGGWSGKEPLFTLVLSDPVVRSTLVARLTMHGADMCTGQSLGEGRRAFARSAVAMLVTDQSTVDMHPGGAAALLDDLSWHRIMVLTTDSEVTSDDPRLVYAPSIDAVSTIARLRSEAQRGR